MKTAYGIYEEIEYRIFDPTGNITALVETAVDPMDQPSVAAGVMGLHPEVEQVGFVTFEANEQDERAAAGAPASDGCAVSLRMAGGEFCGNAAMCSAALYMIKRNMTGRAAVKVKVSGTAAPVEARLTRLDDVSFEAAVTMPPAVGIDKLMLADGKLPGSEALRLPVVRMEGITHVIVEPDSGFFGLKDDRALAETILRGWCGALGAECLGIMFLGYNEGAVDCVRPLTPLVYVPGADTMFWENSCASGSAAAGIYLASAAGKNVDVTFDEPAGRLRVESDPVSGKTVLHGSLLYMSPIS